MNISSLLAVVPVQVYVLNDCCERTVLVHIQCCFTILNIGSITFSAKITYLVYTHLLRSTVKPVILTYASINHFRPLITDVHNPSHF